LVESGFILSVKMGQFQGEPVKQQNGSNPRKQRILYPGTISRRMPQKNSKKTRKLQGIKSYTICRDWSGCAAGLRKAYRDHPGSMSQP
jgi:hypothetical protein